MRRKLRKNDDQARLWMIERSLESGDLDHAKYDLDCWGAVLAHSSDPAVVARSMAAVESLAAKRRHEDAHGRHSPIGTA